MKKDKVGYSKKLILIVFAIISIYALGFITGVGRGLFDKIISYLGS